MTLILPWPPSTNKTWRRSGARIHVSAKTKTFRMAVASIVMASRMARPITDALVETIVAAARREAAARQSLVAAGKSPKWAQGWITARRWEDDQDAGRELSVEEQTALDLEEARRIKAQGGWQ